MGQGYTRCQARMFNSLIPRSQFEASAEGPAGFCEARLEVAGLDGARVYTMPSTHV